MRVTPLMTPGLSDWLEPKRVLPCVLFHDTSNSSDHRISYCTSTVLEYIFNHTQSVLKLRLIIAVPRYDSNMQKSARCLARSVSQIFRSRVTNNATDRK